ncbi:uncharacterized protein LOC127798765 [Diospyros lotus]|uniref:uncharacterized protein LOC127798765 n=1 Tax=Diospyros lotus TaxID=55363 RepID=UPI002253FF7E|nr:uncharacterized protein LOC127798765 [Diospyros lotus]
MAAASHPPLPAYPSSSKHLDLDVTVVSAKHLKNVNWRHGDLKPYAIFWVDPERRVATKSDESGSTRPVWNEQFVVALSHGLQDSVLTLEIFHSKPSEAPRPLVGTVRVALKDLSDPEDSNLIRTFEVRRPSGRPQGKIRLKLSVKERSPPPLPDYPVTPPLSYHYNNDTAPHPRDYRGYFHSHSALTGSMPPPPAPAAFSPRPPPILPDPYPYVAITHPSVGYYPAYYAQLPQPPRPWSSSYGGPSAPVDYASYDQKQRTGTTAGYRSMGVGAVSGAFGGLSLDEGVKHEEEKYGDGGESDLASRDGYGDYRGAYGYN